MAIKKGFRSLINGAVCAFVLASSWQGNTDRPHLLRYVHTELPDIYSGYEAYIDSVITVADILERGTKDRRLAVSYAMLIQSAANAEGIDPNLLAAIVMTESYTDRYAVSSTGALGLGQIVPGLWLGRYPQCGDDLFEPRTNLCYAAKILRLYIDKYVDLRYALNRYSGYTEVYGFTYESSPYTERINQFGGEDVGRSY